MSSATIIGTGISAHKRQNDLSDFADELDMIEELDVEAIEIPTYDLDVVVGGQIRKPQLAALKRATADRDVTYTVHGPLAINFFDEPFRLNRHFDVLKASLEVAAEIGAVHYVMHGGLMPIAQGPAIEDAYKRQREWLAKTGELAEQHKLFVCVENLFGGFEGKIHTASPSRLAGELAQINHPLVRATLDFSHAHLHLSYWGGDFVKECAALSPFAKHLHIHDSFGLADDIWMFTEGERLAFGHGDLHLPVGWGNIPWNDLMQKCVFPADTVFNIELKERYWYAAQGCVDATKALAVKSRLQLDAAA